MSREDSNTVLSDAFALLAGSGGSSTSRQARGERKGACEAGSGALDNLKRTIDLCAEVHKRKRSQPSNEPDLSDAGLSKLARFSDALDLHRYRKFVHLIPRIVNVVSVMRADSNRVVRESPTPRSWPHRGANLETGSLNDLVVYFF